MAAFTLPAIGDTISVDRGRALSEYYTLAHLVTRLSVRPGDFKDWVFDGASMLPDDQVAEHFQIPHLIEMALKHDLK